MNREIYFTGTLMCGLLTLSGGLFYMGAANHFSELKALEAGMSKNFADLQSIVARRTEDIIQAMSDLQAVMLKSNKLDEDSGKLLMLMAQQLKQFNTGLEALSQKLNIGNESLIQQLDRLSSNQTALNRQMLSELQTLNQNYDKIVPEQSRAEFETNVQKILIGVSNAVKHLEEEEAKNLGDMYALVDDLERAIGERGDKQVDALSRMSDALEEVRAEELQQLIANNWKQYEKLTGADIELLNRLAGKLR